MGQNLPGRPNFISTNNRHLSHGRDAFHRGPIGGSNNRGKQRNASLPEGMSDILNKEIVLVLNRNWQAIHIRTPADAFCQMAPNVATALDIEGESHLRPISWEE